MVRCPKCESKIPSKKLFFSGTFKCMSCSSHLIKKYKKMWILVVCNCILANGLFGNYIIRNWYYRGDSIYILLLIPFFLLIIFEAWIMTITLTKLEVAKPYQEMPSPPAPPPPMKIS